MIVKIGIKATDDSGNQIELILTNENPAYDDYDYDNITLIVSGEKGHNKKPILFVPTVEMYEAVAALEEERLESIEIQKEIDGWAKSKNPRDWTKK